MGLSSKIGRLLVACLACTLVVSACGDDGSPDAEASAPSTTAAGTESGDGGGDDPTGGECDAPPYASDPDRLGGANNPVRLSVSTTVFEAGEAPYSSLPVYNGYWEDQGLNVEVLGFAGGTASVQAVVAGQADVAAAPVSGVLAAVEGGADMSLFYTQMTRFYTAPQVRADNDEIQEISDLEGKRIGVQSLETGTIAILQAMMEREGIPAESLDFVAVGIGVEALSFLEANRVDAIALWDAKHAEIENLGLDLREISNDFMDGLGFQYGFSAPRATIDEERCALIALATGIAEATIYAEEDPEGAVLAFWEVYPENKPLGVDDEVAMGQGLRVLSVRQEYTQPVDGVYGLATDQQVNDVLDLYLETGIVQAEIAPDQIWDGSLIEEINARIDLDEIAAEAAERISSR